MTTKICPKSFGFYATESDPSILLTPILGNGESITLQGALQLSAYINQAYQESFSLYQQGYESEISIENVVLYADFRRNSIEGLDLQQNQDLYNQPLCIDDWNCFARWVSELVSIRFHEEKRRL